MRNPDLPIRPRGLAVSRSQPHLVTKLLVLLLLGLLELLLALLPVSLREFQQVLPLELRFLLLPELPKGFPLPELLE